MHGQALRPVSGVVVGSDFSDPTNERLIYLSAAGLALVGLLLLIGTILWWRRGRQEHPVLAPLEVMSGRAWAKAPYGDRRRRLDHVRLARAGAAGNEPVLAEPVDLEALVRSTPQAFDDLREPGEVVELPVAAEPDAAAVEVAGDAEQSDIAEPVEPEAESPPAADDSGVAADPDATSMSAVRPVGDLAKVFSGQGSATAKSDAKASEHVASTPIDPL